jgi:hypothetical protein
MCIARTALTCVVCILASLLLCVQWLLIDGFPFEVTILADDSWRPQPATRIPSLDTPLLTNMASASSSSKLTRHSTYYIGLTHLHPQLITVYHTIALPYIVTRPRTRPTFRRRTGNLNVSCRKSQRMCAASRRINWSRFHSKLGDTDHCVYLGRRHGSNSINAGRDTFNTTLF